MHGPLNVKKEKYIMLVFITQDYVTFGMQDPNRLL